jgi:hypothetical protein
MTSYNYEIYGGWRDRSASPAEITENLLQTMRAIETLDPTIENWAVLIDKTFEAAIRTATVDSFGDKFVDYVADQVERDDWDQPDPESGYWVNIASDSYPSDIATDHSQIFYVQAGSKYDNKFDYSVGTREVPPDPEFVTYSRYMGVLKACLSIWRPAWATAICYEWGGNPPIQPGDPPFPGNVKQMPWFIYLSPEKAAGVDAPSYVQTECAPDGGLILIAADTRFKPLDPDHMRASRALAEILLAQGIWKASSR